MAMSDHAVTPEYVASLASQLAPNDRLRLVERIIHELRHETTLTTHIRTSWTQVHGMIPYPAFGEDAQSWVSRSRAESDRERLGTES